MPREFTPEEIAADNAKWRELKEDLADPAPAGLPAFYEPMFGVERQGVYPVEDIRTTIPESEHGDVRDSDVYTWVDEDEDGHRNYWLWQRRGDT